MQDAQKKTQIFCIQVKILKIILNIETIVDSRLQVYLLRFLWICCL